MICACMHKAISSPYVRDFLCMHWQPFLYAVYCNLYVIFSKLNTQYEGSTLEPLHEAPLKGTS